MTSFDRIVPFIRPLEPFLSDPSVTEIMVNAGGQRVFVERDGVIHVIPGLSLDERHLRVAIKNIARQCGDEISAAQPILDARLDDGSRVAAMFPPCAVDGAILTIRKFTHGYSLEQLVEMQMVSSAQAGQLRLAICDRKNILISGGTGTGKTTLLNALAATIDDHERIVLIEETSEVWLDKPNLIRLETRGRQVPLGSEPTSPPITIAELLRATLRHRPDRIIVGEVRGPEAWDLLQALNTGHLGSLSTIHANSAEQSLTRFTHLVLSAGLRMPLRMAMASTRDAIQIAAHVRREDGRRLLTQLVTTL